MRVKRFSFLCIISRTYFIKDNAQGEKITGKSVKSEARGELDGRSSLKERTLLNRVARAKHRLFRRRANTAQYWPIFLYQTPLQGI